MSEQGEVRLVTAVCQFRGGPGREREAAEAWAFELTYYFRRGIGESPVVTYEDGIYTCTGLMQTTHPSDSSPVTWFDKGSPWELDFSGDIARRQSLRKMYAESPRFWDGRDHVTGSAEKDTGLDPSVMVRSARTAA